MADLDVRLDAGALWITLNRPQVGNALTPDQRNELIARLEEASGDPEVRVVVLAAEGKHFCTGADLSASAGRSDEGAAPPVGPGGVARMLRTGSQRLVAAVLDCEKPVVAELHGAAAGIGAHLVLASDFVVAAEGSRIIEVFARRGLVPDGGGAYLLPRLVGLQKAKELMFFGDDLPAPEAATLGLVNRVVPADALDATVAEWAKRLATGPTRSIGLTKRLLNRSLESDRTTAFAEEAAAQELNMGTHDANEGVAAFVERRDPTYRGW